MTTFTVKESRKKMDLAPKEGMPPGAVFSLVLDAGDGQLRSAEWPTSASNMPTVNGTLEGDIKDTDRGPKFVPAPKSGWRGGGGGGGSRDNPAERRSIAMQHAQKASVDLFRMAVESGNWAPKTDKPVSEMVATVRLLSKALWDQVMEAEANTTAGMRNGAS